MHLFCKSMQNADLYPSPIKQPPSHFQYLIFLPIQGKEPCLSHWEPALPSSSVPCIFSGNWVRCYTTHLKLASDPPQSEKCCYRSLCLWSKILLCLLTSPPPGNICYIYAPVSIKGYIKDFTQVVGSKLFKEGAPWNCGHIKVIYHLTHVMWSYIFYSRYFFCPKSMSWTEIWNNCMVIQQMNVGFFQK